MFKIPLSDVCLIGTTGGIEIIVRTVLPYWSHW